MKKCISLILSLLVVLTFVGCKSEKPVETTSPAVAETTNENTATASVNTAVFGGKEMDYVKFGSGEKTFVIIPGLSVHSVMGLADSIAAAYKDFAEDYTVYLLDRTKQLTYGYTVREMADDTAEAMNSLNIRDAYVFGASQGGMITLYLAADYPELVKKAVVGSSLAANNTTFNNIVNEWISLAEEKNETGLIESFVDNVYSKNTLDAYRDTLISSNLGITDEEYDRFIILAKSCVGFDCTADLSKITCPVLVLGAEGDKVTTPDGSRQLAEILNCDIYMYDDTYGHGVYDEAEDYKQRILDFFS